MAFAPSRSIIVIDDDDDIAEADGDSEILDSVLFYSSISLRATKPKSNLSNEPGQTAFVSQNNQILGSQDGVLTSNPSNDFIFPTFRSLDWGTKAQRLGNTTTSSSIMPGQASLPSSLSSKSQHHRKSPALSLSSTSESWMTNPMLGTADEPIDLAAGYYNIGGRNVSSRSATNRRSRKSGSYSLVPRQATAQQQKYIFLDEDDKIDSLHGEKQPTALTRSLTRHPTADDELIDLESIEVEDFQEDDDRVLQVQDVYLRDAKIQDGRKPSKVLKVDRRNPSIVFPFSRFESLQHRGSTLVQNKTVELHDGSFLRIKDIIFNTQTSEVKLRGHRLQRARDMNGMLEKKLNEVLLFFEVDVDDLRDVNEQAAVEVPLAEVARLRSVRFTNEKFPLHRNVDPKQFANKEAVLQGGGLTSRWKYTCIYASAVDRYHNIFKERTLERTRADECSKGYSVSDAARRLIWRGDTIPGGAYQPTIAKEEVNFLPESHEGSPISIGSSPEPDDFTLVHVQSTDDSATDDEEDFRSSSLIEIDSRPRVAKRKHSDLSISSSLQASIHGQEQKRMRHAEDNSVQETREGISRLSLQPGEKRGSTIVSKFTDLSDFTQISSQLSISRTIDLTSSDLSTPPDAGSFRTKSRTPRPLVFRTAGQKLTYGDAFCGAGGSSRGAAMAGLRILWGFDFWAQACETWHTNFPYATCYHKPAHKFVELARQSEAQGHPDVMKVDILHLSPPCQFFSPAHTIDGVDDEMNTASLFAVQSVMEVSRARVVTLEQTFGIACPRFRFYFNALIQMFTAHDFSIRWAIVPLAQWGLPQRRNRLIIIASCPGEILPRMPPPTHSESGTPPLKTYASVRSALSTIPRASPSDPLHRPSQVEFAPEKHLTPWDDSKILPRAMTTSGGQNYHPSGMRDLTLREYATLQGFPNCHVFKGSYVKKQIGNAVPPCVAKVLFESIKRDLDKVDGVVEEAVLIE